MSQILESQSPIAILPAASLPAVAMCGPDAALACCPASLILDSSNHDPRMARDCKMLAQQTQLVGLVTNVKDPALLYNQPHSLSKNRKAALDKVDNSYPHLDQYNFDLHQVRPSYFSQPQATRPHPPRRNVRRKWWSRVWNAPSDDTITGYNSRSPSSSYPQSTRSSSILANTQQASSASPATTVGLWVIASLSRVQKWGLSALVATLLVSTLQASLAILQYRTNPVGHLVIPPGPTMGKARPHTINEPAWSPPANATLVETFWSRGGETRVLLPPELHNMTSSSSDTILTTEMESSYEAEQSIGESSPTAYMKQESQSSSHEINALLSYRPKPNRYTIIMKRINRFLFLLVPWVTQSVSRYWIQSSHLIHVGIALGLVRIVDQIQRTLTQWRSNVQEFTSNSNMIDDDDVIVTTSDNTKKNNHTVQSTSLVMNSNELQKDRLGTKKPIERVLVLGDSLAVGLGSIEQFEARKPPPEADVEGYWKIENTTSTLTAQQSPVFPHVLASTLAKRQNTTVSWRSAGVDGGAVQHIRQYLIPVLKEQVEKGEAPDVIVLLCGFNDLKLQFAGSLRRPWKLLSPKRFRTVLQSLFQEMHDICPTARVIVPALPNSMFLQKTSLVGIFPLAFFIDLTAAYWECQKQRVAQKWCVPNRKSRQKNELSSTPKATESCLADDNNPVQYLPLTANTIKEWYDRDTSLQQEWIEQHYDAATTSGSRKQQRLLIPPKGFVSIDGIHPNQKCYTFWAEYVADSLLQSDSAKATM